MDVSICGCKKRCPSDPAKLSIKNIGQVNVCNSFKTAIYSLVRFKISDLKFKLKNYKFIIEINLKSKIQNPKSKIQIQNHGSITLTELNALLSTMLTSAASTKLSPVTSVFTYPLTELKASLSALLTSDASMVPS